MLQITPHTFISDRELDFTAIRAQGAGGQNVNKVSSAVHLRFDIKNSSLPVVFKNRLLALQDTRITNDGIIVIKAQESRSQFKNKQVALQRLAHLIRSVTVRPKPRIQTKIKKGTRLRRQESKQKNSMKKSLRGRIKNFDNS